MFSSNSVRDRIQFEFNSIFFVGGGGISSSVRVRVQFDILLLLREGGSSSSVRVRVQFEFSSSSGSLRIQFQVIFFGEGGGI